MGSDNTIYINLQKIRKLREMNEAEFAEYLGVARGTLQAWRTGRYAPRIDTIYQMADKLSLPVKALFEENYEPGEKMKPLLCMAGRTKTEHGEMLKFYVDEKLYFSLIAIGEVMRLAKEEWEA